MNRLPLKRISEYGYFQRLWKSPTLWILYFFVLFGWNINNVLQIKPPARYSFDVSVACCACERVSDGELVSVHIAQSFYYITQKGITGLTFSSGFNSF